MYYRKKNEKKLLYFRNYSRKKYAIFNSLGKQIKIVMLGFTCTLIASPVKSQSKSDSSTISKKFDLEEVEVVGQKSAILIDELPRIVELIPSEEIQNSSSQSYQDFIEYRSNIDIRQRGPAGMQSDISIRGGSFDQTLVLLNGINLTDPQTGHHSLSLPLDLETISKIEILNGPSARALGANAYNGAINIVAVPDFRNSVSASFNIGDYGFFRTHLGVNIVSEKIKNLLTLGYAKGNGYTYNTDFNNIHLFYSGEYHLNRSSNAFFDFGISKKDFGANGYYSARFPDQFESNKNIFLAAGIKAGGIVKTKTQFYWRRFNDRFELFREEKGFYERTEDGYLVKNGIDTATYGANYHQTQIFGADFTATIQSRFGKSSIGSSVRTENLLSNSLGDRAIDSIYIPGTDSAFYFKQGTRNSFEMYLEHVYRSKKLFISTGLMANWNSFLPSNINFFPGLDIKYVLYYPVSFVGSYNYTLGLPTFTDLNYQGPANSGNDKLLPYSQHSYEGGLVITAGNLNMKSQFFYTHGIHNIEWVLNNQTYRFSPINVPVTENKGLEFSINFINKKNKIPTFIVNSIFCGYTLIDTYREITDEVSKYSNIKQKLVISLQQSPLNNITLNWNMMFKERVGEYQLYNFDQGEYISRPYPDIWLFNIKANYHYKFADFYVEVSNLFDVEYYEAGNISQPGRWIRGGVKINLEY